MLTLLCNSADTFVKYILLPAAQLSAFSGFRIFPHHTSREYGNIWEFVSKMSDQKRRNKTADQNWRSQTKAQLQIGKEACTGRPVRSAITSIQDKTTHKKSQTMLPLQIGKGACTGLHTLAHTCNAQVGQQPRQEVGG